MATQPAATGCSLEPALFGLDARLATVVRAIAGAVASVADTLRTASVAEIGTSNALGDKQLVADVAADRCVFDALQECGAVELASSEEQPADVEMGGQGYSVAFDPLDGSSIIGANWAVGSIFGVWPGRGFVGRAAREQVAAAYAVYGPKTVLVVARPAAGGGSCTEGAAGSADGSGSGEATEQQRAERRMVVQEFVLLPTGGWQLSRPDIRIPPSKKVFAPANLRAQADNAAYRDLVLHWMSERYTLRYSGGLVPDLHHILAKGGGVFCNPTSASASAKLRCLYETFPLALLTEAAGGASHDGGGSVLDQTLASHDQRGALVIGSTEEVAKCLPAMRAS
ncbi:Sedoheptulose-1,7-chloroplastic [Micractinium conductrix]|uniref:fructose-bisphosphatase n=1 Tax=Micractinium conductrix TaxID=554055 RepID=A0A2P6VS69_9CHLO|nr:Sedoheptulose-1,7-chloroplastic [Micractinium conductrix]|eukprot:PSC76933.1 Sedoheptulose-1,7-chloroplastic [Micractinium conductrix]